MKETSDTSTPQFIYEHLILTQISITTGFYHRIINGTPFGETFRNYAYTEFLPSIVNIIFNSCKEKYIMKLIFEIIYI